MNLPRTTPQQTIHLAATLFACAPLTGCIVVGASSRGGWFIWPGGFGLVFLILLYIFFFRGRR